MKDWLKNCSVKTFLCFCISEQWTKARGHLIQQSINKKLVTFWHKNHLVRFRKTKLTFEFYAGHKPCSWVRLQRSPPLSTIYIVYIHTTPYTILKESRRVRLSFKCLQENNPSDLESWKYNWKQYNFVIWNEKRHHISVCVESYLKKLFIPPPQAQPTPPPPRIKYALRWSSSTFRSVWWKCPPWEAAGGPSALNVTP